MNLELLSNKEQWYQVCFYLLVSTLLGIIMHSPYLMIASFIPPYISFITTDLMKYVKNDTLKMMFWWPYLKI